MKKVNLTCDCSLFDPVSPVDLSPDILPMCDAPFMVQENIVFPVDVCVFFILFVQSCGSCSCLDVSDI